jgi:hypothetical protein
MHWKPLAQPPRDYLDGVKRLGVAGHICDDDDFAFRREHEFFGSDPIRGAEEILLLRAGPLGDGAGHREPAAADVSAPLSACASPVATTSIASA